MDLYLFVKWLHILSSTVLFGFGAGTAWYFWSAHRTNDPATIASVGRMVVTADWIFTGSSGVIQPATGIMLVRLAGYSLTEPWLIVSYGLYGLAFGCWAYVVVLQIRAQTMATKARDAGQPLCDRYRRTMRLWFLLGWPAFLGLLGIYWLMVSRPILWG